MRPEPRVPRSLTTQILALPTWIEASSCVNAKNAIALREDGDSGEFYLEKHEWSFMCIKGRLKTTGGIHITNSVAVGRSASPEGVVGCLQQRPDEVLVGKEMAKTRGGWWP
ncbi:hypothetical protein B0H19DRAFT_1075584 [Mycena capillaripes]|nr:hypothetical protein B0H19DRAFT_1075584 [Mycena capillaripes]